MPDTFGPSSVRYLAGVGEDITFDLGLIARCTVTPSIRCRRPGEYVSWLRPTSPGRLSSGRSLVRDAHLSSTPGVEGRISLRDGPLNGRRLRGRGRSVGRHARARATTSPPKLSVEGAEHEIIRGRWTPVSSRLSYASNMRSLHLVVRPKHHGRMTRPGTAPWQRVSAEDVEMTYMHDAAPARQGG